MMPKWWHTLIILLIGYALGYWMPKLGDLTLAKIYPKG
jgi:hypothetical protein